MNQTKGLEMDSNDPNIDEKGTKKKKGWSRFHITIEPIKFCAGFTIAFTGGVTIDLLERNICYSDYGMSFAECTSQNVSKDIKVEVEKETAHIVMIKNIIEGIMPLILVLFVGPWSDSNGRKPGLLWAIRGYVVYYLLWSIFSFFPRMPVIFFFLPSIPLSCTGAMITVYVCTWSYTCDNFDIEERTMRFGISVASLLSGNLVGNSLAERVVIWGGEYGFPVVFVVSFLVSLMSLTYTTYVLEETVICKKRDRSKIMDLNNVKSIFDTVIIHPAKGRWFITFVLVILFTEIPTYAGDEAIAYMVGKSQFNWSLGTYNIFAGISSLISGVAPVLGIWIMMDILKISNASILLISCILLAVLQLLKAISINEEMFWAVAIMSKVTNLIGPTTDAELAETVSELNVGKAFAVTSLVDALSPLIALPLYTQLYKILIPDRTLYVYFLSLSLSVICSIGALCIFVKKRKIEYEQSPTEPPPSDDVENCNESTPANVSSNMN